MPPNAGDIEITIKYQCIDENLLVLEINLSEENIENAVNIFLKTLRIDCLKDHGDMRNISWKFLMKPIQEILNGDLG